MHETTKLNGSEL